MSLILHHGSALFVCLIHFGDFFSVKAYASDSVHLLVHLLFFRRVVSLRPWGLNLFLSNVTLLCGSRDYMPYKVTSASRKPNPVFITSQCGERVPQEWLYNDEIAVIPHSVVWSTAQPTLLVWRMQTWRPQTWTQWERRTWSSPACG